MTTSKPAKPLLLLAAILIAAMPMAADVPVPMDVPIYIAGFDVCSGEYVHLSGIAHVVMSVTIDANSAHLIGLVNERLGGNGVSTGASYVADGMTHVDSYVDIDPVIHTGQATLLFSARVIGLGSIPNASVQQLFHVTVNANGNTTVQVSHSQMFCQ